METEAIASDKPNTSPRLKRKRRVVFVRAAICLFVIAVLLVPFLIYIDWPARPAELPRSFTYVTDGRTDLTGTVYVYDFWGNFIDTEHVWRIEASPELIPLLIEHWGLKELDSADEIPVAFWSQPPYWWNPEKSAQSRYFISARFVANNRGPDGDHYLVVYDEGRKLLFVWAKLNF